MTGRPDLTEWHRYRATAFAPAPSMVDDSDLPTYTDAGSVDPDAVLLVSLMGRLHSMASAFSAADLGPVVLVLPSEGWRRPGEVAGGSLLGIPIRLSGDVAWPALQVELSRGR